MKPSRPGLTHRLPVVALLWSTCWLLTGCDVPGGSLTPQPANLIGLGNLDNGPNQAYRLTVEELSQAFSEENFEQFFTQRQATAIWNRRPFGCKYPTIFKHIEENNIYIEENNIYMEAKKNKLLAKYRTEEQAELQAAIALYIAHIKQETSFQDFLYAHRLDEVWERLKQAKWEDTLDLRRMLQGRSEEVQNHVLEGVVHFIRRHCPKLVALNLSKNGLTALPDNLGFLKKLQRLDLIKNQLAALPESLGNLTNLHTLYLTNNQLKVLPASFGNLRQLKILHLISNELTQLPPTFGQLMKLRKLNLSYNGLTELPHSLGELIKLKILYLANNKLTALPDNFGKLKNLNQLNLSNNQLTALPDSLGNLKSLKILYLANNKLKVLPGSLEKLTMLGAFTVENNPFLQPNATLQVTCANLQLNLFPCDEYVRKYRLKKNLNQDINREIVVITGPDNSKTYIRCTQVYPVILFIKKLGQATLSQPVPLCVYLRGKELVERVYDEEKKPATEEKEKFFLIINK